MAFTMPNFPLLNAEQASPYSHLVSKALEGYQNAMSTKYQPKMLEADIFSKQFAPLAQIASNPLAMAMMGDKGQGVMQMISHLLQQGGGSSGNTGMGINVGSGMSSGAPSEENYSPMNSYANHGGISGDGSTGQEPRGENETVRATPEEIQNVLDQNKRFEHENNPNLPSANNLGGNYVQRATAGAQEQLHAPGTAYTSPTGEQKVSSTSGLVDRGQQTVIAAENFKGLTDELLKDAKEFNQVGSTGKLIRSSIGARLNKMGASSMADFVSADPEMAGRYNTLQNDISLAGDVLRQIFPTANTEGLFKKYSAMLEPRLDDTPKTYEQRIKKIVNTIDNKVIPLAKKAMGSKGGFDLDSEINNMLNEENIIPKSENPISSELSKPKIIKWERSGGTFRRVQ